jgi:sugar/nucleoside kinase (ribokinase family)
MKRALFFGLATLDIQYYLDEFPQENVKVKTAPPAFFVGGPATNAAVAFAALNGEAQLITAIGQSAFQPLFLDDFRSTQIRCTDLLNEQQAQPVLATVITTSGGNRTIFTHNPEKLNVSLDEKSLFYEYQPELLMLDGFYPEVAVALAREARNRQIPVVFDGGSWKAHLPDLLPYVDYAICSNDFHPPGCDSHEAVFAFLDQFSIRYQAISRGADPILAKSSGQVELLPVPKVDAIDTLGAGDFFHGAFCYYLLTKNTFPDALIKSGEIASKTCSFKGTREWLNKLK